MIKNGNSNEILDRNEHGYYKMGYNFVELFSHHNPLWEAPMWRD